MSEQEIPAAIRERAKELWRQGGAVEATPVDAIALAIHLERERCAKIADSWEATCRKLADHYPAGHDTRIQNILCADAIADVASCIRDDAAHSISHQAPSSSPAACPADPVGSPLPGSADPFTDTGPQVFSDQEPS